MWDADGDAASSNWRRRFRGPVTWATTTLARPLRVRLANAREAGVSDRVRFEERDVSKGLPAQFDVITTFDVVHDAVDPLQLLQSIRCALRPGGVYVCLDINCSDKLEENANPLGAMFHGVSVFYCMTTSLANNGAGLGTLGFHEAQGSRALREGRVHQCATRAAGKSFQQFVRSETLRSLPAPFEQRP